MTCFTVPGPPQPKGSIRAVPHKTTGRIMMLGDNTKGRAHQKEIAFRALQEDLVISKGPIGVAVTFWMRRPKNHRRANGQLRADAPCRPSTKPDVDKLVRLVLDALTGVAYVDDSQVVEVVARKEFALQLEHTSIEIYEVGARRRRRGEP